MTAVPSPVFVLDTSMTMSWFLEDEIDPRTLEVLRLLRHECAVVPSIWRLETANVLLLAERRKRITAAEAERLATMIDELPLIEDLHPLSGRINEMLRFSRSHGLTAYDAAYLELAMRFSLPLATLDRSLIRAAGEAGVPLVEI